MTTLVPPGKTTTLAPPRNTTTPMSPGKTTTPELLSTATLAPSMFIIRFSLSFRIVNRVFTSSLLDPFSSYYQELELTIHTMYLDIYGCPKCPNGPNYLGFTDLRFSPGSVVTESVLRYRVSNTNFSTTDIEQQLRNSLDSQNMTHGLQLDNIRANSGSSPPATTAPNKDTTTSTLHTPVPPSNVTTLAPPRNTTTPMSPGKTTTPELLSTATLAPSMFIIRFSLSFRIVNRVFTSSLLDPFSSYHQELELTIHTMYLDIYGCPTCPNGPNYLGFTDLRFSPGSVVMESVLRYRVSNTSFSTTDIEQQLRNSLDSQNMTHGLQLDNIRANSGSSPPATTAPPPLVPGWGIALLVLVCILLVLSIVIFILLIVCSRLRKNRGKLDLVSSQTLYEPRSEDPSYHTYGRFSAPDKKQNPFSNIAAGNGSNTFYTNPAMLS